MTDYSKTTDFTGKNSLPDSDPDKIISGVDFDLEFNAVAAASALKADTTYVDAADALKADITYVDSKTSIAYGQIVGLAGEIITEGLVGCSAVIATDGVITVTNTASVPATANMVINATVGKWFQPTTNPKCSLTAIPTSASTWDVRVFDASDTLVPKASIGAYLFSFSVLDNS